MVTSCVDVFARMGKHPEDDTTHVRTVKKHSIAPSEKNCQANAHNSCKTVNLDMTSTEKK